MRSPVTFDLPNVAATEELGRQLAQTLVKFDQALLLLQGDLGAGKTTLVRSFLQALGYTGRVKSPTYTLLETYPLAQHQVYHCDLYRIKTAQELEGLGLYDCLSERAFCLIEWPERAPDFFSTFDLQIEILSPTTMGRTVILTAGTAIGETCLSIANAFPSSQ